MREYRLRKLVRYNNRNRLCDEDVAQHSYFVSLFCVKLFKQLPELSPSIREKILLKAILHDVGETETSDLPYDVKVSNPTLKIILDNIEQEYYNKYWAEFSDEIKEDDSLESRLIEAIVKLSDTYSVLQFCMNEIELGNRSDDIVRIKMDAERRISNKSGEVDKLYELYLKEVSANA